MATLEICFYIFKTFSFYQYSNAINLESHFQKLTLKKSRTGVLFTETQKGLGNW